jgi:alpha-glucosidase
MSLPMVIKYWFARCWRRVLPSRTVYLPKGKWYNFWTNELVSGGQEVKVDTPLDTIPIFVKAGSVIPEYPVQQYVGELEIEEVKLNVYYSDFEANSFLFEDYGETFAYEQDIYLEKKFQVNGNQRGTNHSAKFGRLVYPTLRELFFSV